MFSWLYDWLWRRSVNVRILTLISEVQHSRGRYTLNFDVFKEESSEPLRTTRRQEQYVELPCVSGACSGLIEMPLVGKRCHIQVTVTGALKPSTELQSGEDTLEYKESLLENRKMLDLTPTYNSKSNGMAFIKFWVDGNVKHTVTIHDVPTTKVNPSSLYFHGSEECSFPSLQTNEASDTTDIDSSTVRKTTVRTSDVPDVQCMAIPSSPRPGPKPVPPEPSSDDDDDDDDDDGGGNDGLIAGSASAENDQVDDGATGTSTAYDKILSNASLHCLANVLSPRDARSLFIQLNVDNSVLEHKEKDHFGDSVGTMYQCLLHWRKEGGGGGNQTANKNLYENLIDRLEKIGRRDIKRAIQGAFDAKKELEKCDFKNH